MPVSESSSTYDNNHDIWQDNGKIFKLVALSFRSNLAFEGMSEWEHTAVSVKIFT